jgi:acyl carrier protein
MNEQDKIDLMNHVITLARPVAADELKIDSLDTPLADTGLDSLDFLMVGVFLSDAYGMSEDELKALEPHSLTTIGDLLAYMEKHATKHPANAQEAIANIV